MKPRHASEYTDAVLAKALERTPGAARDVQLLTKSRLQSYRLCPRHHQYAYELQMRPLIEADTLRFGTLAHLALEQWWIAAKIGLPPDARLELALTALREADPFDRARVAALLVGYTMRWGDEQYEVLAVEQEFDSPVVNPLTGKATPLFRNAGKIDVVVRDRQGRVLIVEHKTSSEDITAGSDYWRRLRIDGQISTYYEGARALGYDVWGCLYDVLARPGQKPYQPTPEPARKYTKDGTLYANQRLVAETPDEYQARVMEAIAENPAKYFQRAEVVRLEQEIADHQFDVWLNQQSLRESQRAGRWPRNPDACVRYGRTCEYFAVCTGEASIDDPLLFRRSERHEELNGRERRPDNASSPEAQPK